METLFTFIAKSSGLLVLFYCAYYFLLRKETFFSSNRWFLLAGLVTSMVLPFIVYKKTVWVDPSPLLVDNFQINAPQINAATSFSIDWNLTLIAVYAIGFLALVIKFAFDFYSLNTVLKGKKVKQQADFKFVDINENIAPFSYFDYIVYNSSLYSASELESILEHEKVHSEQNHTIDVLISRIFCVLFWFNPIIWLYKKAILQNLEFIADNEAAQKISDKKAYQYTLLKITTHENCVAITNHFYQSLIKKRIIMLNKKQSKKRNSWKFYVILPALAAFVLLFQVEVIAKEKQQIIKDLSGEIKSVDVYKIKKNSTDAELKDIKEKLKSIHNIDFEVSDIKRNAQSDLTSIIIDVKSGDQQSKSIQTGGTKPIKDFGIIVTTDKDGKKKVGFQTGDETNKEQRTSKSITINQNTNSNTNTDKNAKTNHINDKNTSSGSSTNIVSADAANSYNYTINSDVKNGTVITVSSENAQKSEPLIIVDGIVITSNKSTEDLQKLNIQSMNVFKGPEASKKYGEEGKNGVIVIETKKE